MAVKHMAANATPADSGSHGCGSGMSVQKTVRTDKEDMCIRRLLRATDDVTQPNWCQDLCRTFEVI